MMRVVAAGAGDHCLAGDRLLDRFEQLEAVMETVREARELITFKAGVKVA